MPRKTKGSLLVALAMMVAVIVFTDAGHAIQAKCVNCNSSGNCEYLEGRDGDSVCEEIPGGCASTGECTISLRFSP